VVEELVLTIEVEVVTAVDVVVVGGGGSPPGGSRWNIIPSEATPPAPAVVPTANPFVLDSKNMLWSLPSFLSNGGIVATVLQAVPSQCKNTGLPVAVSWPTAQPSAVEVS
jgi:hypothetical protein